MLAVDVLVQAVVVARPVLQQQRRRPALVGGVAARQVGGVVGGIAHGDPHRLVPAVGNLRERRVERGSQGGDDLGQRVGEILVLAAAEAVPRHDDAAAEGRLGAVEVAER